MARRRERPAHGLARGARQGRHGQGTPDRRALEQLRAIVERELVPAGVALEPSTAWVVGEALEVAVMHIECAVLVQLEQAVAQ